MIPKRTISATCEISTGTLILDNMAPTFVGESCATQIEVALKNGGSAYTPSGCQANMFLFWPGTPNMTGAVEMTISGSTLSGEMTEDMMLLSGCPLLVIQLLDESTGDLIVAAASPIQIINVRGSVVISGRAPSPSEIIYIGRAPYIGNDGHWYQWDSVTHEYQDTGVYAEGNAPYINSTSGCWMVWDPETEQYVDSGVVARGTPATFTASATTLSPGSAATATITGTAENPVLNLGIPRGADSPVQTVCGVSPDGTGNVPVKDENIPCTEITGQTTVEGAIASLNSQIGNLETDAYATFYYNADTNVTVEANRTAAIKYVYLNYLKTGIQRCALIRFASGFYATVVYFASSPSSTYLMEMQYDLNPHVTMWLYSESQDIFTKAFTL